MTCVCVLAGLSTHDYLQATMSALGQRSLADYPGAGSLVGSDYSLNLEGETYFVRISESTWRDIDTPWNQLTVFPGSV